METRHKTASESCYTLNFYLTDDEKFSKFLHHLRKALRLAAVCGNIIISFIPLGLVKPMIFRVLQVFYRTKLAKVLSTLFAIHFRSHVNQVGRILFVLLLNTSVHSVVCKNCTSCFRSNAEPHDLK